jgi:hypothetical protein
MVDMAELCARLRRWFTGKGPGRPVLPPSSLVSIGKAIETTSDDEFDCEQTNRLLDQFAEAALRGEDSAPWMDLIQAHLDRCPDCQAEFEALLHVLETEDT